MSSPNNFVCYLVKNPDQEYSFSCWLADNQFDYRLGDFSYNTHEWIDRREFLLSKDTPEEKLTALMLRWGHAIFKR